MLITHHMSSSGNAITAQWIYRWATAGLFYTRRTWNYRRWLSLCNESRLTSCWLRKIVSKMSIWPWNIRFILNCKELSLWKCSQFLKMMLKRSINCLPNNTHFFRAFLFLSYLWVQSSFVCLCVMEKIHNKYRHKWKYIFYTIVTIEIMVMMMMILNHIFTILIEFWWDFGQ